tara:strand:- start:86 stop:427 length:342 start_codon:yes stop_codon:yes gene_type:complete
VAKMKKKYQLDNGRSYTVDEAQEIMHKLHGKHCSTSLMYQRFKHSTDPGIIFMDKDVKVEGGHMYSNINLARKHSKKFVIPKPEIKLTPAQKAMKRAYVVAGIYYGGPDGHAA